jgi:hypothetical protein
LAWVGAAAARVSVFKGMVATQITAEKSIMSHSYCGRM